MAVWLRFALSGCFLVNVLSPASKVYVFLLCLQTRFYFTLLVQCLYKKLSCCWETVRRESMPTIAEIDVEMKTYAEMTFKCTPRSSKVAPIESWCMISY